MSEPRPPALVIQPDTDGAAVEPLVYIAKAAWDAAAVRDDARRIARNQRRKIVIAWCEEFFKDEAGTLQVRQTEAQKAEFLEAIQQAGDAARERVLALLRINPESVDIQMPAEQALSSGFGGMWSNYWQKDEDGTPTYTKHHDNGAVVRVLPDLKSEGVYDVNLFKRALTQEVPGEVMERIVEQLGPRAVDHAMLLIAYGFSPAVRERTLQEAPFEVSLRDILRVRGIKVRGAQLREALEGARKDLYAASSLMLDLTEAYDAKHKKSYHWRTRLFAVLDEIKVTQGDLFTSEEVFDYRLRVTLGGWTRRYIERQTPSVINLSIKALRLSRSGPEELAKKLIQRLCVQAGADRSAALRVEVGWLLQEIGEVHPDPAFWPRDRKWKGRLRERFDAAVEVVDQEGLAVVTYPPEYPDQRGRRWFENWMAQVLEVALVTREEPETLFPPNPAAPPRIDSVEDVIALRKSLGLSQAQMAEALGVSNSLLCLVEKGKRPMSRRLLGAARTLQENRAS